MSYKNNVREIRETLGMPVSELARRSETTRQTITNIELHGQEPSITLGLKIAEVLKSDPYKIFFTHNVIQGLQKRLA